MEHRGQLYMVLPPGATYPTSDTNVKLAKQIASGKSISTVANLGTGGTKSTSTVATVSSTARPVVTTKQDSATLSQIGAGGPERTTQHSSKPTSNILATIDLTADDDDDDNDNEIAQYTDMGEQSSIPTVVYPTSKPIPRFAMASTSHTEFDPNANVSRNRYGDGYDHQQTAVAPGYDSSVTSAVELEIDVDAPAHDMVEASVQFEPDITLENLGVYDPNPVPSTSAGSDQHEDATSYQPQLRKKGIRRGTVLHSRGTKIPVTWNRFYYGRQRDKIVLKRYVCQVCGRRCMKDCDLQRHIRIHTGETPYSCIVCKKKFAQKHNMVNHRRRHRCKLPVKREPKDQ